MKSLLRISDPPSNWRAEQQSPKTRKEETKQFAVRLIGRYIFCWFLKEKGIISEQLLMPSTIRQHKKDFFQKYLRQLFFNTLNEEVASRSPFKAEGGLDELYDTIPYLNGGLFEKHPEDKLFDVLDLNDWLIAFVKVLENFDFTVDESSSQYQQVAIDPEMLGRIFENLMASLNPETEKMANQRKAFGAFYTPREIVDYMVNQALKSYLEEAVLPKDEYATTVEEPLVEYKGTLFQDAEPKQTLLNFDPTKKAIADQKRKRLQEHIDKFFNPDCASNPFDKSDIPNVQRALSEVKILDPACGSGAFPMGVLLRLMELRQLVGHGHRNNYDLKSEILSRNIYGVDIMPMAVEIARLRAWLSLVLEADYKPADRKNNFGVSALPNLDFKFVCANSLIDSGYDAFLEKAGHNLTLMRLHGEVQKLERIRDSYFDPKGSKHRKEELQKEFESTKNYIKTEFNSLKKTWNLGDFLSKVDDWNPFDDSHPSSFFSSGWMFGIKEGFDVVIGNPPYIPIESIESNLRDKYKETYNLFSRKFETSVLFISKGLGLLKKTGVLSYIAPMTWQTGENYSTFRKHILTERGIIRVINLPFDVFEAAYIDTSIYLLSNKKANSYEFYSFDKKERNISFDRIKFDEVETKKISAPDYKLILNNDIEAILSKFIGDDYLVLGDITKSTQGLSGSNFSRCDQNRNSENVFPFLNEGNAFNYLLKIESVYNTDLTDKKNLKQFYLKEPKVLIRRIINRQDRLTVAYCNERLVFKKDINPFVPTDKRFSAKYLLALLASSLMSKIYISTSSIATKDDFRQTTLGELRKLPIRIPAPVELTQIEKKADEILSLKSQDKDTSNLERNMDAIIYRLYKLSFNEVKVIDPAFWLSEEEYNNFKVE